MNHKLPWAGKAQHFPDRKFSFRKILFLSIAALCLFPVVSPPLALLLGILVAQLMDHPYPHSNHKATRILLQCAVVGLGFGMDLHTALRVGKEGFLFTVISIFGTLLLGYLFGKLLKIHRKTSFLISAGTAICGGSAIAAISPVIGAEEKQISVALGTIFILNSLALFLFPAIGHWLGLSQAQFGIWSAIAIQDTSSVVGAVGKFGAEALQIATTVKLMRALWIIPIAFASALVFKTKEARLRIPYFIGLFVLAIVLNTYLPFMQTIGPRIVGLSKAGLTLTLFLIGSGLSRKVWGSVGLRPILQGVVLWLLISLGGLWAVISLL
ncbi:YeiH family protein [Taibaiella koreensis]|uniref:YeiH family protein n=1 Tax=Taibaiella koreensis TaxID=1268548 RepID=UPI000E59F470|nr:putative sulfate exporter family transporter [Taibaiella koreensis]